MTSPSDPGAAGALLLPAADGGGPRAFACFDRIERRPGGVFLAGPWFLELAEEAELEITSPTGPARARVRVIELVRGDRPGMLVRVLGDDAARARIDAALPAA